MEIKPEDELSNIVLFPVKEDDPRNQVNFLYEPSERPYCHHASVRVDEKERQVRCKICGAVVEPFDWMLSVAKRETRLADDVRILGNDSNLLIVFYVQIMPDDLVMQLHRF
ncbi:putative bacteriophage protein [Escherichia coli]|nr:putative bacteriophage protein [Escherichia coli]